MRDYAFPKIGKRKVAELIAADFAEVLRPIWREKAETASRVKQRCHKVMKWCWAQENWSRAIRSTLSTICYRSSRAQERDKASTSHAVAGHSGICSGQMVRDRSSNVTRALLEFVILTAARSGEARAITWDEIDLHTKVWTVPDSRMKAKVTHRVPLSARAVEILKTQREMHPDAELVFPSPRGLVLSDMALTKFLRDHKAHSSEPRRTATAHGFRSSFRDWASREWLSARSRRASLGAHNQKPSGSRLPPDRPA